MRKLILTSALTALVFMAGCCSHPTAMMALDRAISANQGHMDDSGLPQEAREIAEDNFDVHWKVKADLDSDAKLPADVAARQKAREEAEAAAAKAKAAAAKAKADAAAAAAAAPAESDGE